MRLHRSKVQCLLFTCDERRCSCTFNTNHLFLLDFVEAQKQVCLRLCRYYIRTPSMKLPIGGCSFECYREAEVRSCCPGYWGPDCIGEYGNTLTSAGRFRTTFL